MLFRRLSDSEINAEEPLRYEVMTGLRSEQLTKLASRVYADHGGEFTSRGRRYALGLFGSVAMVVCLMRKNITQEFAGAIFGVSQPPVSRRWDLLRPVIGQLLAEFVPDLDQVVGQATVLVDGTLCPTWDWGYIPDLFGQGRVSGDEHPDRRHAERATGRGRPDPGSRARHDAHAFAASDLRTLLADLPTVADLGYVGVEGIELVPSKQPPGGDLTTSQAEFNTALSKIRAAVERAIAHLKTWRMLSEEGGRYRAP